MIENFVCRVLILAAFLLVDDSVVYSWEITNWFARVTNLLNFYTSKLMEDKNTNTNSTDISAMCDINGYGNKKSIFINS